MPTVIRGDFEWDSDKAESNISRHGVTFQEALTVFSDRNCCEEADPVAPDRILTTGYSARGRILLVVSTERFERTRIISARKATAQERAIYEDQ